MPAPDLDLLDRPWPEGDYGEGKTRQQEAFDSAVMLAGVMLFGAAFALFVGISVYIWVF